MRARLVGLLSIVGTLAGVGAVPAWAAAPDRVAASVLSYLGVDAVACGRFKYEFIRGNQPTQSEVKALQECMASASGAGRTFYFSIEGSGVDSYVATGLMRNRSGELQRFWYDGGTCAPFGCPGQFLVATCPAPTDLAHIDPFTDCSRERASSPTRG